MASVGAYEAKTHLPELLERVRKGERIVITRHGNPVAELVPAGEKRQTRARDAVERILEFQKTRGMKGMSPADIRALVHEGHRV